MSIGFLIASIVPTARFAQPIGAAILYPMLGLCGLFAPVHSMPPALQVVAHALPLTYAVSLLEGIRKGEAWSAHMGDVAALVVGICDLHGAFSEGVPLGVMPAHGANGAGYRLAVLFTVRPRSGSAEPGITRVKSSLGMDGHHIVSMCSITNSVPRA